MHAIVAGYPRRLMMPRLDAYGSLACAVRGDENSQLLMKVNVGCFETTIVPEADFQMFRSGMVSAF